MKNIVHVIFSLHIGGAELMLVDIINEQVKNNRVSLIVINNIVNQSILDKLDPSVKVYLLNRQEGSRNPKGLIQLNWRLHRLKPDVLHCHNARAVLMFLPKWRRKSVMTLHLTGIEFDQFNLYKKLFAITKAVQEELKERCNVDSILVYNGVNVHKFYPSERGKSDEFKIVQVSRLEHNHKGQHILIEALSKLLATHKDLKLKLEFIGDGNSRDYLTKLVGELNLTDNVKFLGAQDREYIYRRLANSDLLVQPSMYEGFGLTIAEAMLAKVPVLISALESTMEVIGGGKYGDSFEVGNVDDLANKLYQCIEKSKLAEDNIVEEAYQYALQNFNIEETAKRYVENY